MKKLIISAKHWQLFSIAILVPGLIAMHAFNKADISLISIAINTYVIAAFGIIMVSTWAWSTLWEIQKYVLHDINVNRLKIVSGISIVAILVLPFLLNGIELIGNTDAPTALFVSLKTLKALSFWFIPEAAILFYMYYFIAHAINKAEQKQCGYNSGILVELIRLVFFPIGIWDLQPKIQRILSK